MAYNTTKRPTCLDLFCGAGGASRGLQMAGFHVTGVDIKPQPRYAGDHFIEGDALSPPVRLSDFDFIWASPPCQAYTMARRMGKGAGEGAPELIEPVREMLVASGRPYTIENVVGAPLIDPVTLCGSMFGLDKIRRHRLFESNFFVWKLHCRHSFSEQIYGVFGDHPQNSFINTRPISVTSGGFNGRTMSGARRPKNIEEAQEVMGIDWMGWKEITQAIPPAYSEYIGKAALHYLKAAA